MTATFTCRTCGHERDRLEEFPGRICVTCYEISQIGAPLPTAEEIVAMFSGGTVLRTQTSWQRRRG